MIRKIRHWLRLPLLTKRQLRTLNGFWWCAALNEFTEMAKNPDSNHADKQAVSEIIDEFIDAIEWIEKMKA